MSANPGHTSNLRSGNPNASMHLTGQGGRPRTMIVGMALVAVGFYGFWRLQFMKQNRSHTSSNPAEMPTWQYRHAQQVPEFNERVSSPGGTGTNLRPRERGAQLNGASLATAKPVDAKSSSGGGAATSNMVHVGSRESGGRGLESGGASERGGESHAAEDPRGKDNHVQTRGDETPAGRGVVASLLTAVQGDPRNGTQDENGHVGEPAGPRRMNDRGGIYTKNSDYKDGFRRD
ncbi:hypothetical protein BD413DRAFT_699634 [Trametes elegans]|nr:hypothetical protein BD413DRAFT_699634 [Trametes elegans]